MPKNSNSIVRRQHIKTKRYYADVMWWATSCGKFFWNFWLLFILLNKRHRRERWPRGIIYNTTPHMTMIIIQIFIFRFVSQPNCPSIERWIRNLTIPATSHRSNQITKFVLSRHRMHHHSQLEPHRDGSCCCCCLNLRYYYYYNSAYSLTLATWGCRNYNYYHLLSRPSRVNYPK